MGSSGKFRRDLAWNLAGQVLPLGVALASFPIVIATLGPERFGLLAVAWVIIGYFGLLDLGLGRALTRSIAERVHGERGAEVPGIVATGLVALATLGFVGAAVLALAAPGLAGGWLKIPVGLREETWLALSYLAAAIPVVLLTTGLRGVLEGMGRFDLVNLLRVPLAVWLYLAPLLALPFTQRIDHIVLLLIAGRVLALFAHAWACASAWPGLWHRLAFDRSALGALARFGGWVTVSNVISPLMTYFDRLVIGIVVSIAAVGYYSTPHEVVFRLTVVAEAIAAVLFAAASSSLVRERSRVAGLVDDSLRATVYLIIVPVVACVTLSQELLGAWLGPRLAAESHIVLQLLAVGILFNSVARVPFALLQAAGRPDLTAAVHLLEVVPYALLLWYLVTRFGIDGAAAAWTLRVVVDLGLLLWLSQRVHPVPGLSRLAGSHLAVCAGLLLVGVLVEGTANRLAYVAAVAVMLSMWCWRFVRTRLRARIEPPPRKA